MTYLNIKGQGSLTELLKHYKHDKAAKLRAIKVDGMWRVEGVLCAS